MRSTQSRLQRLASLVAEVRAQQPPEPSEPGLPVRLRREFSSALGAARGGPLRTAQSTAAARWLPRLALAALLAGGAAFVIGRSGGPALHEGGLPASVASLDGQALGIGVLVVATERPRLVEHAGRASWVLATGSEARVLSAVEGVLRVSLERGSLDVDVLPSPRPESFVVQARGTEVAVHGTRFRVTLPSEQLLPQHTRVAVSQGQVQVRPLGQSSGTLLGAGMQADFAAGVLQALPAQALPAQALPAESGVERGAVPAPPLPESSAAARGVRPARPVASGSSPSPASLPRPERALPAPSATPSASGSPAAAPKARGAVPDPVVEQAVQTVTGHVQDCFRLHIPGSSGLGIEASTFLALSVEPNGVLLQANFEPPLAPAVEACVAAQLAQLKVAPSSEGYHVEREIRLRR